MIKVTYDNEVDAKYISIKEGKFYETKTINDSLFFDVDIEGDVLGVEILDSSKSEVTIETFDNNLVNITYLKKNEGLKSVDKAYNKQKEYIESEKFAVAAY
jgi:uncharacterized protein YuzE